VPAASIRAVSDQAGYSGTPLPRKLGINPEHRVLLVEAPTGFDLGPLPPGATVSHEPSSGPADITLVFCRDRASLIRWFAPLKAQLAPAAALWIAWPKKAAKIQTDLDEQFVREHGLAGGLVDVKICAVDQVWSGLKFVYRLSDRAGLSESGAP
jgi:hypothetical protein